MSDYLCAIAAGKHKDRFVVDMKAECRDYDDTLISARTIIDTGCSLSKLSMKTINSELCDRHLELDITDSLCGVRRAVSSVGVTDLSREVKIEELLFDREKAKRSLNLCFVHKLDVLLVNGYDIDLPNINVKVSYAQTGASLLGMNILNKFDFHCGTSKVNSEYMFLGCLKDKITEGYIEALEVHFGYRPTVPSY